MVISDIIDDYKIQYKWKLFEFATYEEFDTVKKSFLEKYGDESDDDETLFFNMLEEKLKYTFDEQVLTKELKHIQPEIFQDIYNRALLLNNNSGGSSSSATTTTTTAAITNNATLRQEMKLKWYKYVCLPEKKKKNKDLLEM